MIIIGASLVNRFYASDGWTAELVAELLSDPDVRWVTSRYEHENMTYGPDISQHNAIGLAAPASRVGRHRIAGLASFFLLVNVASLEAVWNLLSGRRIDRWEPRRTIDEPAEPLDAGPLDAGPLEAGRR